MEEVVQMMTRLCEEVCGGREGGSRVVRERRERMEEEDRERERNEESEEGGRESRRMRKAEGRKDEKLKEDGKMTKGEKGTVMRREEQNVKPEVDEALKGSKDGELDDVKNVVEEEQRGKEKKRITRERTQGEKTRMGERKRESVVR